MRTDLYERRSCIGMRRSRPAAPRFVICIDNSRYPASLELHKVYRVVSDDAAIRDGDLRVVDESGEDYLYPAARFVPVALPAKARGSLFRSAARAARRGR